jgi:hypothetical protein
MFTLFSSCYVYSYKNAINIALILAVNDVIDVGVE